VAAARAARIGGRRPLATALRLTLTHVARRPALQAAPHRAATRS
jgi:hypothetical protein